MTKDGSKFNEEFLNLDVSEYDSFLSNFQQNVLITFGTTFMPNEELSNLLVSTFKQFKNVGFIISLKDNEYFNSYSLV